MTNRNSTITCLIITPTVFMPFHALNQALNPNPNPNPNPMYTSINVITL